MYTSMLIHTHKTIILGDLEYPKKLAIDMRIILGERLQCLVRQSHCVQIVRFVSSVHVERHMIFIQSNCYLFPVLPVPFATLLLSFLYHLLPYCCPSCTIVLLPYCCPSCTICYLIAVLPVPLFCYLIAVLPVPFTT